MKIIIEAIWEEECMTSNETAEVIHISKMYEVMGSETIEQSIQAIKNDHEHYSPQHWYNVKFVVRIIKEREVCQE